MQYGRRSWGIAKSKGNLENLQNVADFEEEERDGSSPDGKGKEMKNPQGKIRKLKREIEKGEFGGLIIDRSQAQQDVDTQIDRRGGEFEKKESSAEIHELERDGSRNSGG